MSKKISVTFPLSPDLVKVAASRGFNLEELSHVLGIYLHSNLDEDTLDRILEDYIEDEEGEKERIQKWEEDAVFKKGDKVRFDLLGMLSEWESLDMGFIVEYDGQVATILSPEISYGDGDKDFEYYNIQFEDGEVVSGVSGYHLEELN